jgi:hypothetical protein
MAINYKQINYRTFLSGGSMLEYTVSIVSHEVKDKVFQSIKSKDCEATLDDEYPISKKHPNIWVTTSLDYDAIESIPGVKSAVPVYKGEGKPCSCGSGLPRYKLEDARGIFCAYVCEGCEKETKAKYRPEVFENASYEADEDIDPEESIYMGIEEN